MRKVFFISGFFIFCGVLFFQNRASSSIPALRYQVPEAAQWSRDKDLQTELIGPEHYYFGKTENIDLNIIPIEDDLLSSLNTRGAEQFVSDIMHGKNSINTMFGADESKLVSKNLSMVGEARVLEIKTTQAIETKNFTILEKYYIYQNQAVNFQLRWSEDADPKELKTAQALFAKISTSGPKTNK